MDTLLHQNSVTIYIPITHSFVHQLVSQQESDVSVPVQLVSAIPELPEMASERVNPLADMLAMAICGNRPVGHNFGQRGLDYGQDGLDDLVEDVLCYLLRRARQGHEHLLPITEERLKVTACSSFSCLNV